MKTLKLVTINPMYCNYLREFDNKVVYNNFTKKTRPFVGVLFDVKSFMYFAPLASPKAKHLTMKNTMDFLKIDNGKLGAINFNNMIPVINNQYQLVDLGVNNNVLDRQYKTMLQKQLYWLNANIYQVQYASLNLYFRYCNDTLPSNIKARCCNFKLLEEKAKLYKEVYDIIRIEAV